MKVVVRRTGLSPHLIRMWERRYRAVVPDRTNTGRRLYSDADISRLSLLRQATEAGESIGQIATLPIEDLARLIDDFPAYQAQAQRPEDTVAPGGFLDRSLKAAIALDGPELEAILLEASVALGQQAFLDRILMPLLDRAGELWEQGDLKISQEHLASAVVRSLLGIMALTQQSDQHGPLLLTTTPSGQRHEFGALAASVTAVSAGWRSAYLGPDLPAEEIASAAKDRGARAVALSLVYPGDDPRVALELRKLVRLLDGGVTLLVGGRASQAYQDVLEEIGAVHVHDLAELRSILNQFRNRGHA